MRVGWGGGLICACREGNRRVCTGVRCVCVGGGGRGRAQSKDRYGGQIPKRVFLAPLVSVVLLMVSRRGFQGLCCQGLAFSALWTMSTCILCGPGV